MKKLLYLFVLLSGLTFTMTGCSSDNNPDDMEISGSSTPDDNAPATVEVIDLGLSVRWASHNLGAEFPEEYGGYYGWADPTGEQTSTDVYNENRLWTSALYGGSNPPVSICGTAQDIVYISWGGTWRLPTHAEIQELEACSREWITQNGINGYRFTGSNGNSIFLPAAGSRLDESVSYAGTVGYYWTGTLSEDPDHNGERAYRLYMGQDRTNTNPAHRYRGQSIRPVCK